MMIYQKIQSNYKPTYAKSLRNRLYNTSFLREYGNIMTTIIDSNQFWNNLRQRVDFLVYANVLKYSSFDKINPEETNTIEADLLFEQIEKEIKSLNLDYEEILIDELFRQFTRCINGKFIYSNNDYEYFSAPYFSSEVYGNIPDQGTIYLDNLTTDLFDEPLEELIKAITIRMEK
ncbi:hypothetical protein [Anaerobacillus alkalilacustris]|nr:hypothetical protein [Anaerobacillus alkalilacustris]